MAKRSRPRYNWPGLYSAYPTRGRCECGTDVLFGHHDSWEVRLDRPALGLFGECEALLNGCTTYLLVEPHIYRRSAANAGVLGDYGNFNPPRTFGLEASVNF